MQSAQSGAGYDILSAEEALILVHAVSTCSVPTAANAVFNNTKLRNTLGSLFAAKFLEVSRDGAVGMCRSVAGGDDSGSGADISVGHVVPPGQAIRARASHRSLASARKRMSHVVSVKPETTWKSSEEDEHTDSLSSSPSPAANSQTVHRQSMFEGAILTPSRPTDHTNATKATVIGADRDNRNVTILISEIQGTTGGRSGGGDEGLDEHGAFLLPSPATANGAGGAGSAGDDDRIASLSCSGGMLAGCAIERAGGGGAALVCELCGRRFTKPSALMQHRRWHTGEKPAQPHRCEQCGRGFSSRNSLHIHRAIHSGEKPYACEVCGKRFSTQTYLWHHRAVHSDARPYSCEYCACDFKMRSSLNNHLVRHHALFAASATGSASVATAANPPTSVNLSKLTVPPDSPSHSFESNIVESAAAQPCDGPTAQVTDA